jgi:hypothetical protein
MAGEVLERGDLVPDKRAVSFLLRAARQEYFRRVGSESLLNRNQAPHLANFGRSAA